MFLKGYWLIFEIFKALLVVIRLIDIETRTLDVFEM